MSGANRDPAAGRLACVLLARPERRWIDVWGKRALARAGRVRTLIDSLLGGAGGAGFGGMLGGSSARGGSAQGGVGGMLNSPIAKAALAGIAAFAAQKVLGGR